MITDVECRDDDDGVAAALDGRKILLDTVGLEICLQVCENLTRNPGKEIPRLMYNLVKEGLVSDSDLFDAGIILGAGFPEWTGGPINYARQTDIYRDLISKIDAHNAC